MSQARFARSAATDTLLELLVACAEGGTVSYAEMAQRTNRDIQFADRHLLTAAQRGALKAGAAFSCVHRVGLQRLHPAEVQQEGHVRIKRIHRAAKRGGKLLDSVSPERLTAAERIGHAAVRGILAAVAMGATMPRPPAARANVDPVGKVIAP